MDYATNSTAQEAMWGGFIPFGLCTLWGLRLVWRGLRGDILDSSGSVTASRSWFIIAGVAASRTSHRLHLVCLEAGAIWLLRNMRFGRSNWAVDAIAMKSFRLHRPACPSCRSQTTAVDVARLVNLWRLPMAVVSGFLLVPCCRVGYRCRSCSFRFLASTPEESAV